MKVRRDHKPPQPVLHDVVNEDALYSTRSPSSTRRYRTAPPVYPDTMDEHMMAKGVLIQRRRSSLNVRSTSGIASNAVNFPKTDALPKQQRASLPAILVGMVIMILFLMTLNVASSWWQTSLDDLHYGRPRTSQLDAVVGHDDSPSHPTHFLFINLNRHVEIIEIPGGDMAHTRIFLGPILFGDGQDLTPVTGEIREINGKRDLIVHIQNQQILFINDGTTFHPQ